jgi:hypothetical protein
LLTDQGFVFLHGMFGMKPDQGKKIRINRYVGISLAKLRWWRADHVAISSAL